MSISAVHIPAQALADIRRDAVTASPRECCGLLIGMCCEGDSSEEAHVSEIVRADNHAPDPHRFMIDPQVQFDWMRKLRGTDQCILGHYHSHPNGRAQPSDYDGDMAHEAGQIWLIAAIEDGTAGEVRAYVSQGEGPKFHEIPVVTMG